MSSASPASPDRTGLDIPSLDGLRAVSFMIVFVSHAGLDFIVPGGFGVTVFFFLSGFLITTLLRLEQERHGRVSLGAFYLRRVLRIWPPFYTVLGLGALITALGLIRGRLELAPMLAQLLHFNNYWTIAHGSGGIPKGMGVYWSLAVEEHFYLLFPALFILLHRVLRDRPAHARVLYALCGVVLAWRCVLVYALGASEDRTYMASDTRVESLLWGCALALAGNPALDPTRIAERIWKRAIFPGALLLLLVSFAVRDPGFRETLRYSLQGLALTGVFVPAIRWPGWGPFRLLNLGPVKFVGLLSYSLYLLHHTTLFAVHSHLAAPKLVQGIVGLAACLLISYAIYVTIEKPAARLRKKLSKVAHRSEADSTRGAPAANAPAPAPVSEAPPA